MKKRVGFQRFHGEEPHGHVILSCPLLFMHCNMPLSGLELLLCQCATVITLLKRINVIKYIK